MQTHFQMERIFCACNAQIFIWQIKLRPLLSNKTAKEKIKKYQNTCLSNFFFIDIYEYRTYKQVEQKITIKRVLNIQEAPGYKQKVNAK